LLLANKIKFCNWGRPRSFDENVLVIIVSTASGYQTLHDRVRQFIQNFFESITDCLKFVYMREYKVEVIGFLFLRLW